MALSDKGATNKEQKISQTVNATIELVFLLTTGVAMVRDAAVAYTDEQQKLVFEADDAEVVATEIFFNMGSHH